MTRLLHHVQEARRRAYVDLGKVERQVKHRWISCRMFIRTFRGLYIPWLPHHHDPRNRACMQETLNVSLPARKYKLCLEWMEISRQG